VFFEPGRLNPFLLFPVCPAGAECFAASPASLVFSVHLSACLRNYLAVCPLLRAPLLSLLLCGLPLPFPLRLPLHLSFFIFFCLIVLFFAFAPAPRARRFHRCQTPDAMHDAYFRLEFLVPETKGEPGDWLNPPSVMDLLCRFSKVHALGSKRTHFTPFPRK